MNDAIDMLTSVDIAVTDDALGDESGTDIESDFTAVTEADVAEPTDGEVTDELGELDSTTESVSVVESTDYECHFDDSNILAKMDIIIMLLIVMIAVKLFAPLAHQDKSIIGGVKK